MVRVLPSLALTIALAFSAVAQEALTVTVDRPHQNFAVGEEVVFRVESPQSGTLTYELGYSERAGFFETGERDHGGGVTEVRYRPTVACFLYLRVRLNGQTADIGVVVGRDEIDALADEPDDFDAFWAAERAKLAEVPLDLRREQVAETEYSTSYRFSAGHVDGRRVYGFVVVPKGGGPKPAAVRFPPFGSSGGASQPLTRVAEKGNVISVNISIHDAPAGQTDPNAYEPDDPRDRATIYYRLAVLACVRAIDMVTAMPEWDQQTVIAWGNSQGGGLAMLTAGIDTRVTHVIQSVAALSQHAGAVVGQASGFPYFLEKASDVYGEEGVNSARTAVKYYDAVFAARRFRGPSLHFVNYKDPVCPPATHYAATNQMRGPRIVLHSLDLQHSAAAEFGGTFLEWVRAHIPATRNPPFFYESEHLGYAIDASPDQTVASQALLSARAGYDGSALGPGWTAEWRQLEGPTAATLSSPGALATAVALPAAGTYRFRLEVTAPHHSDDRRYYLLTDEVTVVATGATSSPSPDLASVRDVRIFPNPTRGGSLHIEASFTQADHVGVTLYDLLGREVLTSTAEPVAPGTPFRRTLSTAGLPSGTYLLVLRGRGGIHRETVAVE